MANVSYILCIYCDTSEKNGLIFIPVWYSNQLPCVADICKIAFHRCVKAKSGTITDNIPE